MKPWLILAGGLILGLLAHNTAPLVVDYAFSADATGTNTRPFGSLPGPDVCHPAARGGRDGGLYQRRLAANCGDTACTTFGTTVTGGGGALKLLVWYNGAEWTLAESKMAISGTYAFSPSNGELSSRRFRAHSGACPGNAAGAYVLRPP